MPLNLWPLTGAFRDVRKLASLADVQHEIDLAALEARACVRGWALLHGSTRVGDQLLQGRGHLIPPRVARTSPVNATCRARRALSALPANLVAIHHLHSLLHQHGV